MQPRRQALVLPLHGESCHIFSCRNRACGCAKSCEEDITNTLIPIGMLCIRWSALRPMNMHRLHRG